MTVPAMQDWPLSSRDQNWDGGAARARVVDFYTKDDVTDWAKVHKAFFYYDPDKAELKTGHKLGYVDIIGGTPKAVVHGLFAVAGGHGVQGTEGIPSEEVTKIKKQVNTWYGRMKAKFPNDDFDFDPPFPEVKEKFMAKPDTRLDGLRKEYEKVKTQLKDHLNKKFMVGSVGNATSFADLAAIDAIWETIDKVFDTVWDFQFLAENIAWNSESPNDMLKSVKDLSIEMASIFTKMAKEVPGSTSEVEEQTENDKALSTFINGSDDQKWVIKQRKSSALLKNNKGDQFFYGRFTNNLWDKEGEVLITEAHQEFIDYLDSNPDEAPELWDWHEEETAKTNKAVWWDFSDGFLHAIWPVTDQEAKGIEAFMEEFEPGMSHGFKVLKRLTEDKSQIAQYRTKEASILPLEFAANEWTTFEVLELLKEKSPEERFKMFSPEKVRALELLSLGEYVAPLGKASEDDAAELDAAGAQRKDHTQQKKGNGTMETKDVNEKPDVTEETAPTPAAAGTTTTEAKTIDALQASIVEGFDLLTKQIAAIAVQVQSNTEALKGIKEKKGQSPSVAAWVAAQKAETAVGDGETPGKATPTGELADDDPLFGEGPAEEPFELDGHLLSNL